MSVVWAALVVLAFALIVQGLRLPDRAREVGVRSHASLAALRDREMDDGAKEKVLQRQAVRLFALMGWLVGGSLLAIGLPLLGVWALDRGGVASLDAVLDVLERIDFLLAVTVVGGLAWLAVARARRW